MTERELWLENPLAFWLDPDRWYGVPEGEFFWDHLDKRPPLRSGYWLLEEAEQARCVADLLRLAGDAETLGCHDIATLLRQRAARVNRRP